MNESNLIPMSGRADEAADEVVSIDLDTLSDDQLDALSDESIHCLPEADRQKIACRYFVANELLPPDERNTLEWIAGRVGISVRQFHRWRKADFWPPLLDVEYRRARSYVGDIRLLHLRPRMKELEKLLKKAERASDGFKIVKEFARIDEKLGITAVDRETQGAPQRARAKILKVISRLPPDTPTAPEPGESDR